MSAGGAAVASRLQGVVFAQQYLMLDYDCPRTLLERATAITPGLESPTVAPLADPDWVAVRAWCRGRGQPGDGRAGRAGGEGDPRLRHPRVPALSSERPVGASTYHRAVSESVRRAAWWSRGITLGRLFGVPVAVTPSWFLSLLLIAVLAGPVIGELVPSLDGVPGYLYAFLLALLLGVSVLAHELGHCAVARRQGVGVVRIELFLLGGVSEISRVPRSAREEAGVAAAGPVVSAVLTGIFAGLAALTTRGSSWWLLTLELALANGIITVFNLLPALPLDGGRILRAGVWRTSGDRRRGTVAAVVGGYLVAALLFAWSVWRFTVGGHAALVQGVIGLAMAGYIAVGARSEQVEPDEPGWPAGVTVSTLARPALNLPVETPVDLALRSAAGPGGHPDRG